MAILANGKTPLNSHWHPDGDALRHGGPSINVQLHQPKPDRSPADQTTRPRPWQQRFPTDHPLEAAWRAANPVEAPVQCSHAMALYVEDAGGSGRSHPFDAATPDSTNHGRTHVRQPQLAPNLRQLVEPDKPIARWLLLAIELYYPQSYVGCEFSFTLTTSRMPTFERNPELLKKDSSLRGAPIYSPKHQCIECGKPVKAEYAPQPKCYDCEFGSENQTGPLSRVFPVSIYLPKRDWDKGRGGVITDLRKFAQELLDAKDGEYKEKMTEILAYGVRNSGSLSEFDLIVIPPSSSDFNHMKPRAELLEDKVNIPFRDVIDEVDDTGEMKKKDTAADRKEATEDSYRCVTDVDDERIIIADDVVTTGSTMSEIGRALKNKGAGQIAGLSITRSVDLYALKTTNLVNEL